MKFLSKTFFLGLSILLFGACSNNEPTPAPEPDVTPGEEQVEEPDEPYILEAYTPEEVNAAHDTYGFAFGLLKQLGNSTDNVVISPQSATFALSMLANGASDATLQELIDVLGYTNMTIEDINAYNRKLMASYILEEGGTVTIANALFTNTDFPVNNAFKGAMKKFYGAQTLSLDNGNAIGVINQWISEKTNGKIPALLSSNTPGLAFAMANTIYMKSGWAGGFEKELTAKAPFSCADGHRSEVDMMNRRSDMMIYERGDSYQMVEMPLNGNVYSVLLVLPDEGKMTECLSQLPSAPWLTGNYNFRELIQLSLPKVNIDYKKDLTESLKNMGLKIALSGEADYSLINESLTAPFVLQGTFFSMDEEGIEAAAASFEGWTTCTPDAPTPQPLKVEFNRPFLFIVRHNGSHTIPFLGMINRL